ncbi:GDCCVxC domain-containing (seleno)protein [Roseisalinus antarcticus]
MTCPLSGHAEEEVMPTDACQFFYKCAGCGEILRPKAGACCGFCFHGAVSCPPIQDQ